jgi:hypothetical protein
MQRTLANEDRRRRTVHFILQSGMRRAWPASTSRTPSRGRSSRRSRRYEKVTPAPLCFHWTSCSSFLHGHSILTCIHAPQKSASLEMVRISFVHVLWKFPSVIERIFAFVCRTSLGIVAWCLPLKNFYLIDESTDCMYRQILKVT